MRLCNFLGLRTGLNTYTSLLNLLRKEINKEEKEEKLTINADPLGNELTVAYAEAANLAPPSSSLWGKVGVTNLLATLGDIFMGGKKLEKTFKRLNSNEFVT